MNVHLLKLLKNIIKVGVVSSVNPSKSTARVVFGAQNVVSHNLVVLQRQTRNNKDYYMPDVGEQVVCIFLPTGNAEGFIIGSVYNDEDRPPTDDRNKRMVVFKDGTKIEYDSSKSTLTINATGPINIVANKDVNVTGDVIADGISLKNHTHPLLGKPQ
ncbi:phage baseplate assembly protein V [Tepidanaerobacter syntrophicus]|uniref:Phage baseplate assembly protein V n=1 Tax=Tepidanaerobacter syntrophicus TaxID=224999 RepID=A0A0U9HBQ1_9FIRM|nr:phage baseplate assembly protein V [Tepidanaerobacter syntrophicus]GAQ24213.1 phage baseplate assembly protein V [Tepidanaerobacter syntrophicus]